MSEVQFFSESAPEVCVVAIHQGKLFGDADRILDVETKTRIATCIEKKDFQPKLAQTMTLHCLPHDQGLYQIILVGCGKKAELSKVEYRKVIQAAAAAMRSSQRTEIQVLLEDLPVQGMDDAWKLQQLVQVIQQAMYRFTACRSKQSTDDPVVGKKITFSVETDSERSKSIQTAQALAAGIACAKDLANTPGNLCTPDSLKQAALSLEQYDHVKVKAIDEDELAKLGAGAFKSVSQGSPHAGQMIFIEYMVGPSDQQPVALVGKGITFDTGGISLKPGNKMHEMKFDMCGAASVIGTMQAVAQLGLPLNVVGVVAAAENMPSGEAIKPGDVVTTLSGQTVEILNTDAEGRLVLCDALTKTIQDYSPESIIDIATLTGACLAALGEVHTGLFTEDDTLAEEISQAAELSCDSVWRLPLEDAYQDELKSSVADIANIGKRYAGATTAACFLSRFTSGQRWAHLDIAGTAWRSSEPTLATGRPVALLFHYVCSRLASV